MEWTGGYSAEWTVFRVNRDTWEDDGVLEGVTSVSIDRSRDEDAPLLETGSMTVMADSLDEGWYRVCMTSTQQGRERWPMATLLFERSSARFEHGARELTCTGRSALYPASQVKLAYGTYAPAGCDGAAYAAQLIADCSPAPVRVEGGFTLVDDVVFDIGASYLEAAWLVLDAAGWCMQVTERGEVVVRAKPTEPALELNRANAGLLVPGVDDDWSIEQVPNRYYAVDDDRTAMATNEDEASAVSYQARGRWVDVVDTSPTLVDGESLEMYAARKLQEATVVTRTYGYTREYWPACTVFDVVRASLADNGLEGDLRVKTQRLECGKGVTVTEEADEEVVA